MKDLRLLLLHSRASGESRLLYIAGTLAGQRPRFGFRRVSGRIWICAFRFRDRACVLRTPRAGTRGTATGPTPPAGAARGAGPPERITNRVGRRLAVFGTFQNRGYQTCNVGIVHRIRPRT